MELKFSLKISGPPLIAALTTLGCAGAAWYLTSVHDLPETATAAAVATAILPGAISWLIATRSRR
jgi:hypothetical protein